MDKQNIIFATTTGGNNQTMSKAFAKGSGIKTKEVKASNDYNMGCAVVTYGILRGSGPAIRHAYMEGFDYWYIDHGYFGKSKVANSHGLKGYFRIVNSNKNKDMFRVIHDIDGDFPEDRLKTFNLPFKKWRKNGSKIVVVPPSGAMGPFIGISPQNWVANVKEKLMKYTDREIVVCTKQKGRKSMLQEYLKDAWALVTDHSNSQVDALVSGIPVITTSKMRTIGSLEQIEDPPMDRRFLKNLAYKQWSREEIESGKAWSDLNDFA
tara:strand:+ start:2148 stop:2942 length:795 start_codon:yes stop_codon:yes gene_type:complete